MQCSHYCCLSNSGSSWGWKQALVALLQVMILGSVCQNILVGASNAHYWDSIMICNEDWVEEKTFIFSMISNRWKSLKTRLSARSELSCRWLNLHTCKDTWRLIFGCWSRHRCPNPPLHPQESRPTPYWVVGRVQWIHSQYMWVLLVTCKF